MHGQQYTEPNKFQNNEHITNAFYTIGSSRLGDALVYINITYTKFIHK